ncbi:hypothetical protein EC919_104116 [Pseudomonas graminis]|nr:hypothetical protein EC919_104116 [Pseudomonas graminis]
MDAVCRFLLIPIKRSFQSGAHKQTVTPIVAIKGSGSDCGRCGWTNPDRWLRRVDGLDRVVCSRLKKTIIEEG